jgi:predicted nucleotide-binding protein
VRELIERHLALQVVVYTDSALIGKGPFENLEAMVSQCGYAVIVLTKDDQVIGRTTVSVQEDSPRGRKRGRQNVIHEIGYCQGRMGVERVLILFEDGVEIPSNIAYLHGQPIKSGNIEDVYRFLAKHLKKKCNNP